MQNCPPVAALDSCKILACKLPDCSCEKCKKPQTEYKRALKAEKPKQEAASSCMISQAGSAVVHKLKHFKISKLFALPSSTMPSFNFPTHPNLQSFMFDIVGTISFFIMATFMFWITVGLYLWRFLKMILLSGRKIQLIVLLLLLLVSLSITYQALRGRYRYQQSLQLAQQKTIVSLKLAKNNNTSHDISEEKKGNLKDHSHTHNCNVGHRKHPTLCDLCQKKLKGESQGHTLMSDEEAREMYEKYKLYSMPLDMKYPPSMGNIFEIALAFFNAIIGPRINNYLDGASVF